MRVKTITVGAFQENCYLVVDDRLNRAVIVDPGSEGERLLNEVDRSGAKLEAIWITQSGAAVSSDRSQCFALTKIWSTNSPVICDEEKRSPIL